MRGDDGAVEREKVPRARLEIFGGIFCLFFFVFWAGVGLTRATEFEKGGVRALYVRIVFQCWLALILIWTRGCVCVCLLYALGGCRFGVFRGPNGACRGSAGLRDSKAVDVD